MKIVETNISYSSKRLEDHQSRVLEVPSWDEYYQESKNNILEQVNKIKDIKFVVSDYSLFNPSGCVIYCDPPYQGTKQYDNAKNFDYDEFWNIIRKWSKDNIVIVSELNAPSDFKCIWEKNVSRTMKSTDNTMRADERMFTYNI